MAQYKYSPTYVPTGSRIRFDIRLGDLEDLRKKLYGGGTYIWANPWRKAMSKATHFTMLRSRDFAPIKTHRMRREIHDGIERRKLPRYGFVFANTRNPRDNFRYPWALNFAKPGRYNYNKHPYGKTKYGLGRMNWVGKGKDRKKIDTGGKPTYKWFTETLGRARPFVDNQFRMALLEMKRVWETNA